MAEIAGKVVVVTGASSGIGAETARQLAAAGAHLMLGARRTERLAELVGEVRRAGGVADFQPTDVTLRAQVEALVAAAESRLGPVDVMINNAGLMANAPLECLHVDEWEAMIDVNLKGLLYGIAAALPGMKRRGRGHIINVASVSGHVIFPNAAVYCGTKFAVRAISEGLRHEVGPDIRVTILSPGAVATELSDHISHAETRAMVKKNHAAFGLSPDAVARAILYAIGEADRVDVNEILIRHVAQPL